MKEALYFTPEDHNQIDIDGDGKLDDVDLGDTRMMSQQELEDIHKRLQDPSKPLFDIRQHQIGDCHLLSTLNAYNQTEEGRKYLASLVTPHYNAQGKIDGYFVDFPGYGRNEKRVFVQDVMTYGDTAGNSSKADLASVPRGRNEEHVPPRRSVGELLSNHHAENLRHSGDPSRER